jgi:hypothetical protein
MSLNFHEDLKRPETTRGSSDRTFGLIFALFFLVLCLSPMRHAGHARIWWLVPAGISVAIALLWPRLLHPANRAWTGFGVLLGRIVNPIVMAILFFLVFTPAGVMMRMLGKDPLRLKQDRQRGTYWIPRDPPGPQPESMSRQF